MPNTLPAFTGYLPGIKPWTQEVHKSASYTVLSTDTGSLFIVDSGTVTFTLPTLVAGGGLICYFFNVSATAMVITAPSGKLIGLNNAAGTSCSYSTASNIIGSACMVWLNDPGTFYHIVTLGGTPVMS